MKTLLEICLFGFTSVIAHDHEPAASFVVDYQKVPSYFLSLRHQSSLDLDNGNIIILHGLFNPYSQKSFHHELGVGYRKIFENWGVGANFVYAHQNSLGFHNWELSPGLEAHYKHFALVYNYYKPIKPGVKFKNSEFSFYDTSEITLSYNPSRKYEFGLSPYFNHTTKKMGYSGYASAYIFDNWRLAVVPFCEPSIKAGVSFSLGYHFGGAKRRENEHFKKSHRFYHSTKKMIAAPINRPPVPFVPFIPVIEPVVLPPPEVIYVDVKPEQTVEKTDLIEPEDVNSWSDYLFFWRRK